MTARERLKAIQARYEASQPGDWYVVGPPWGDGTYVVAGGEDPHGKAFVCDAEAMMEEKPRSRVRANAQFIAHSKADIRFLLQLVDTLAKRAREAREALKERDAREVVG